MDYQEAYKWLVYQEDFYEEVHADEDEEEFDESFSSTEEEEHSLDDPHENWV